MTRVLPLPDCNGYGFLHRADPARTPPATVVMLNAGLIHRVGPWRMNVDLAERLRPLGLDLFRFDLPGVGDAPLGGSAHHADRVGAVLDAIESATGCRNFVVGGLCSAADIAWKLPESDARISGLILLDPCAVRGRWFRLGQLQRFMSRPVGEWIGMLRRGLRRELGDRIPSARDWPAEQEFVRRNRQMMANGIGMYVLYTSGVGNYFLHPQQMDAGFPGQAGNPRMRMRYQSDIDHIMFVPSQRTNILDDIAEWLKGLYPQHAA
ncbi:MAG: hypothetical protein JSR70_08505 [Proteobacteria bacterium]|nr:hypothetical protein [Pseudomonadota bacterium]